jgi:hypothetical protein
VPLVSRKGAKGACVPRKVRLMPWHNYAQQMAEFKMQRAFANTIICEGHGALVFNCSIECLRISFAP